MRVPVAFHVAKHRSQVSGGEGARILIGGGISQASGCSQDWSLVNPKTKMNRLCIY